MGWEGDELELLLGSWEFYITWWLSYECSTPQWKVVSIGHTGECDLWGISHEGKQVWEPLV